MSDRTDLDRFVKDPGMLVELCREVIDHLDASSDAAVAEQEAQLRAIARAVEGIEKDGFAVPDPLRAEKTRLAASLAVHADAKRALAQLADEFQNILTDVRNHLGQNTASNPTDAKPRAKRAEKNTASNPTDAKPRGRRSKSPRTPPRALREHIVSALKKLGGKARASDVIEEMGRQLEGKLLPGDLALRRDAKTITWQNNACWERNRMREEGVLRGDSRFGIWELVKENNEIPQADD